jgi:hypothetical protein
VIVERADHPIHAGRFGLRRAGEGGEGQLPRLGEGDEAAADEAGPAGQRDAGQSSTIWLRWIIAERGA